MTKLNVDVEFLMKSVSARNDVVNWLNERPYVGLDVTDVEQLARGFDYLGQLLAELTGTDLNELYQKSLTDTNLPLL